MNNEFWAKLAKDNPNGISFEPLSMRLWCKQAGVDPAAAKAQLASHMLKLNNLWYCPQMLASEKKWAVLNEFVANVLSQFGFFSVGSFLRSIDSYIDKIKTEKDASALLAFMGYELTEWQGHKFCIADSYDPDTPDYDEKDFFAQSPKQQLENYINDLSIKLSALLHENGEIWLDKLLGEDFSNLDLAVLEALRQTAFPQAYVQNIDGHIVWNLPDAIGLPEDFPERITYVIDLFCELNRGLGAYAMGNALDVLYGMDFRNEYGLSDDALFLDQCLNAYAGDEELVLEFANKKLRRRTAAGQRTRSKDNNFKDLGIPVGSFLHLCADPDIICEVEDEQSRVRYNGEVMYISTLAQKLLNGSGINGFRVFCYEGEPLNKRRQRLEQRQAPSQRADSSNNGVVIRRNNSSAKQATNQDDGLARDEHGNLILGLRGRPLTKSFWRDVVRASNVSGIYELYQRFLNGETYKDLSFSTKYKENYIKKILFLYQIYRKIKGFEI